MYLLRVDSYEEALPFINHARLSSARGEEPYLNKQANKHQPKAIGDAN